MRSKKCFYFFFTYVIFKFSSLPRLLQTKNSGKECFSWKCFRERCYYWTNSLRTTDVIGNDTTIKCIITNFQEKKNIIFSMITYYIIFNKIRWQKLWKIYLFKNVVLLVFEIIVYAKRPYEFIHTVHRTGLTAEGASRMNESLCINASMRFRDDNGKRISSIRDKWKKQTFILIVICQHWIIIVRGRSRSAYF